jgi:hypothetical protein
MRPESVTLLCACAEIAKAPESATTTKDLFMLVGSVI